MSESIAVVGCGAAKKDGTHPAKELYTSNYFRLKREYAEKCCTGWVILSAKYGIIDPDREITAYDTTIDDLSESELQQWAEDAYAEILKRTEFMDPNAEGTNRVVWLAGDDYVKPIERVAMREDRRNLAARSSLPFRNTQGIGEQMAWLKQQVRDETSEQSNLGAFA